MSERPPGSQLIRKPTIVAERRGTQLRRPVLGETTYRRYRRSGPSTAGSYGGINGGIGAAPVASAAASVAAITPVAALSGGIIPTALGPSLLTNMGSSVSKAGVNISNTFGSVIPLAIKIIIAVIVIKIVLWLVKRRR